MSEDSLIGSRRSSSPFVSQLVGSRSSSEQLYPSVDHDQLLDDNGTNVMDFSLDDKENIPFRVSISPRKQGDYTVSSKSTIDTELMPPPSSRTPRRSPLRPTSRPASCISAVDSSELIQYPTRHDSTNVDDTCFSTFSEVPDLLQITKTSQSPFKRVDDLLSRSRNPVLSTPQASRKRASPSRSPSPTPRRLKTPNIAGDGTQSFLIDFTQQMDNVGQAGHLPSSRTEPNLLQHLNRQRSPAKNYRQSLATPAKQSNILNLLDFELPPAPTPRSIPTITVRELETLKSQYLSQISSLKATLSGREAEVESLKRAIGDAERRVGDAQQALKEERNRREQAEQERTDWERRGLEVENVLNNVREEVLKSEADKEDLVQKLDEYERRLSEADLRATTAEEGLSDALALRSAAENSADMDELNEQVQRLVASQIDAKIEAVSRELHAVYKEKHERKVATLKKSYEARSEKRCAEMQARVQELEKTTNELKESKAALLDNSMLPTGEADLKAQLQEQRAHLARVEEELNTSQAQQSELMQALEQERIEKGDLVAAVDEMLALQADQGATQGAMSVVEDFRKSISRPGSAMLRRPSESRIGRIPSLTRTPASSKSKMLANIEKMGRSAAVFHE